MASKILFVLSLLFRAALLFPVSQYLKSVQSSNNVADVELTERTVVIHPNLILSRSENTYQVKSLDSVTFNRTRDANSVKRTKRELIVGNHSCAQGRMWILNMCVTQEKYNELKEDNEDELTALPGDEGVTLRSRKTPRPEPTSHPGPTSYSLTTPRPKPTPHPRTTPRLELTPHFLTTPRLKLTPHPLTTPRPDLTPHSLTNNSSKQDHISSSVMHLVVILVIYQIWCNHRPTY